jgi:hypothetical protein
LDVNVGSESGVVGEIPAWVVGIVINDDVVPVPVPVIGISEIERGDAEIETVEPETVGSASAEVPYMARTEACRKAAVFPGMVNVVVDAGAIDVTNPFAVVMNVRRLRMAFLIAKRARLSLARRFFASWFSFPWSSVRSRRTMPGGIASTHSMAAGLMVIVLRKRGNGKEQRYSKNRGE